jgi:hypothetical protein
LHRQGLSLLFYGEGLVGPSRREVVRGLLPLLADHMSHGGLNILGKKSWNVYNYDNRERVRKDEEKLRLEEEKKRKREEDIVRHCNSHVVSRYKKRKKRFLFDYFGMRDC